VAAGDAPYARTTSNPCSARSAGISGCVAINGFLCDHDDVEVVVGRLEALDPGFRSAMAAGQFELRSAYETYFVGEA
jgi:hypothetical protein